jgi:thiamine biosynthesis lipoprotein
MINPLAMWASWRKARGGARLLAGLLLFACATQLLAASAGAGLTRFEESRVSMGSTYTVVAYGRDARQLPRVVAAALDEVDRIDRLMSHYKPDSPLSRLNREAAAGPASVEPELFDFIAACLRYSQWSEGAFDITVGPLMKAWGFFRGEGRMPGEAELAEARGRVGYRRLTLDAQARTIQFDRPGVELDLGGIAKGYAVDRAVDLLKRHGIKRALVSAGGSTLYGLGAPPGVQGWEIKVRDPIDSRKTAFTVVLKDRALSISGGDEKFFEVDGVKYAHVFDPRTGRPVQGVLGVAVLAESGTAGDALDNVFYVQGVAKSREQLKALRGVKVYFFLPDAARGWKLIARGSRPRAT